MNSSSGCSTVPTITMLCKKRLRVQGHVQVGKPPVEALLPHFDENKSSFRFLLDIVSRFKMAVDLRSSQVLNIQKAKVKRAGGTRMRT
ncbi:Hypothetical predicted protein [Olea europaea subsp. europaea]|uniref:Uncharacterized protein n=1 Tax=Olea europaea subsp. europaea TaxID=158383 RepID=A0A8S0QVD7_OLEEU|nr:Hypothetical predicted protein [Olea europaea subsp. europaea]